MINGYSGYYNGIFLRSTLEFAFAYYLDYKKIKWAYELKAYDLVDIQYVPDFFILDENDQIISIIETKGDRLIESGIEKIDKLENLFGIKVVLLTQKELTQMYRKEMPIRYNQAKKIWINDYSAKLNDRYVDGNKNPMYGLKHKEQTKKIISKKAKERFKDPLYAKNCTDKLIAFNRSNNFKYAKEPRVERIKIACLQCGNEFVVTINNPKERKFCSEKCARLYNGKLGNEVQKKNSEAHLRLVKKYIYTWSINNEALILDTPYNKISTTLNPLFEEIEIKYNIKDKRTISKAMFGEDKGRKELLLHLKDYVTNTQYDVCRPKSELTDGI